MFVAMLMSVVLERSKVALSRMPLGTVSGVQLIAVFQSPLVGLRFQVALPARVVGTLRKNSETGRSGRECTN